MSRGFAAVVFAVTLAFFGAFFLWPILQILRGGFLDPDGHFTLTYVVEIFTDPLQLVALRNSFLLATCTTLTGLLIALPLAFVSDRYLFPGKQLLGAFILVPMILPPFVGAIGIRQVFGQYGAFNALLQEFGLLADGATIDWFATSPFWGVVVVQAFNLYPILYLNIVAALANVDPAMEEAAANLGCTGLRRFRRITLPLINPGVFAGATIVFIWSFTELGVPLIFDYSRVTSVQIYYGLKDIGGSPFPYALVAVMLAASVALYALGKGLFGRKAYAMMAKATSTGGARDPGPVRRILCTALFASVTFVAILPHLGVILVAFSNDWYGTVVPETLTLRNFELAIGHSLTVPAIANSLKFAGLSTIADIVIGVAIAYVIVRTTLPGRQILDAMAMMPLAVPGLVMAFGYLAMSQEGHFFAFLNPVENPTALLIIAYAVRRLPYMVRAAVAGLQQTSVTLEEAAQNLGCPPLRTTMKITLPLISANVIAGGFLVFSFAMLEVSDSLILAQKQLFYPITKAIFELFQLLGDGRFLAAALGVWAMAFLAVTVGGVSLLLGRRLGAIFRV
ncbi:MAG: iron ABC transporter permease [Verrucomicrobia bacterium]|nr:MAG: iron ABC transporter permease [Verrucomicrobiota bacterium]